MIDKLIVKRKVYSERWAQCLGCLTSETLPFRNGKLDAFIGEDGCRYYGKFKQVDGNVYHNCGDKWSLCELYPDFRESDG